MKGVFFDARLDFRFSERRFGLAYFANVILVGLGGAGGELIEFRSERAPEIILAKIEGGHLFAARQSA